MITVETIEELRRKVDGVIVADANNQPLVRSRIYYDGPDPLETGEQVVVGEPAPTPTKHYNKEKYVNAGLATSTQQRKQFGMEDCGHR